MLRLNATVKHVSSAGAQRRVGLPSVARATRQHSERLSRLMTAAAASQSAAVEEAAEEDFYSLLGVSPLADGKEIKAAYYRMVRTCHPDRSRGDDEATDFCAMLNEVYETLSDPTKRALYDELAGFSAQSVNPFLDDRYPADRVFVDEFSCIGCRNCNNVCPKTFGMEEDYGRARVMVQDVDSEEKLQEAIDTCPVSCIHWVTAPQLNLLESAMARMERIAVWSMMGGSGMGANKDVFVEASYAWNRRQSEIRARVAEAAASYSRAAASKAQPAKKTGWGFWNNAVEFGAAAGSQFYSDASQARAKKQQQEQADGGGVSGDRESRAVAGLAARAARAARTWRRYQDVAAASRREKLVLSSTSSASSMDSVSGSMDEGAGAAAAAAERVVQGVKAAGGR
ncbi:hypothetical protein HYH02_014959 [Chlamydomonas schloesseri]|uniref:Uncharacterized protein n=1 Tax=Chlamydomonas schloesseri TaxID=2026947 RepID=A0A835VTY1_9CHLO|nr:hypothetical protein HYH02_014959 [Chlamydomonas schloesseri]|eukprot:KAG2425743.1 hypothetical protein HYH02_014959 [Chlamydomonas schloesseri]